MSTEETNGNTADSSVQQVSELLDRLVLGSKDDPAELGYTVAVTGIAALEQVRTHAWPKACSQRVHAGVTAPLQDMQDNNSTIDACSIIPSLTVTPRPTGKCRAAPEDCAG
jgi:hypothetical protein